jgi:SAM-dependent methyltransferase
MTAHSVNNEIKLHLGASNCSLSGWVNTDITPHIWIAKVPLAATLLRWAGRMTPERYEQHRRGDFNDLKYMDLTKPLPFSDASVSAVFSSHVFEHLFFDEVDRLVREIRRILVPGGVCRTAVPDLEKIMPLYDPLDPRPFVVAIHEIGQRADIKHVHHCGFTGESLRRTFEAAGFSRAYVTEYGKGICPDIDKLDNRPESSVFVEAVR